MHHRGCHGSKPGVQRLVHAFFLEQTVQSSGNVPCQDTRNQRDQKTRPVTADAADRYKRGKDKARDAGCHRCLDHGTEAEHQSQGHAFLHAKQNGCCNDRDVHECDGKGSDLQKPEGSTEQHDFDGKKQCKQSHSFCVLIFHDSSYSRSCADAMYQNKKRRYSVSPGCHAISRNCIRDIINPDFTGSKAVFL